MFLRNSNIISKIKRSKVTDYAALTNGLLLIFVQDYVECESDQTVFLAEVFAMDRTVMKNPIKLWERGSEKYFYSKFDRL